MTFRFNTRHLALVLSFSAFFSCKKDETPKPTPTEPTLFELVQGRWNATLEAPRRTGNVSPKEQVMPSVAAVEFFSDSTYILAFDYDEATVTGKFSTTDSAAFNFDIVGSVTNVKLESDSISFTLMYHDHPMHVKAGKVEALTISADNKPLLKSWKVEKDLEDGDYFYEGTEEGDKVSLFFSPSGSFLLKRTDQEGEIWSTQFANWKWHADVANAFVPYSIYGYELTDSYFKIISISNTSLTIEEVRNIEGQQQTRKFVLTAE